MTQDLGASANAEPGSRASAEPSSTVSALTGFDPARMNKSARALSPSRRRNLLALPQDTETWSTISEMRHKGATGSGMDLLYVMHVPRLCVRRWTHWGGETGQKRGEGYEYHITEFGLAVRDAIAIEARQRTDPEEGLDPKGESAGPQDIAQGPSQ